MKRLIITKDEKQHIKSLYEQVTNEPKNVFISLKKEGWGKLPQDLVTNTNATPPCAYSGYYLSFEHNNIFYDIDMSGLVSGVRGDVPSFDDLHKTILTEGIVEGQFMCGTNESLIKPLDYEGTKYISLINSVPSKDVLKNVKEGDKTIWGGFNGSGENFIIVNNGGQWVTGKLTHRKEK